MNCKLKATVMLHSCYNNYLSLTTDLLNEFRISKKGLTKTVFLLYYMYIKYLGRSKYANISNPNTIQRELCGS
mgnify:CR=1 FL=1